jgi:hypothetical protein
MSNNQSNDQLVIARGITKKDGKKPGQVLTRLFFDVESANNFLAQLQTAIQNQQDGISLTVLEGEGKNGAFGMVAASAMEARPDSAYATRQRAYTAPHPQAQQAAKPAYTPKATGGFEPKAPGYTKR